MGLTKQRGNMYSFVTHVHTHLRGECGHGCVYCYVKSSAAYRCGHYKGPLRLDEKQLGVRYGKGKTIFVEHMSDLFEEHVPDAWIRKILEHCLEWPDNEFVFQTKNPNRARLYADLLPPGSLVGTTIETNRGPLAKQLAPNAPWIHARLFGIEGLRGDGNKTFVTVEPILDFDMAELADVLSWSGPEFVTIGADSKSHGLPEPNAEKVRDLLDALRLAGIEVREKHNLDRLMGVQT